MTSPVRNQTAAQLIAATLEQGRIDHPGDKTRNLPPATLALPMFRCNGRPPIMADAMRDNIRVMSEGLIHLIEQDHTIIPTNELEQLRAQQDTQ